MSTGPTKPTKPEVVRKTTSERPGTPTASEPAQSARIDELSLQLAGARNALAEAKIVNDNLVKTLEEKDKTAAAPKKVLPKSSKIRIDAGHLATEVTKFEGKEISLSVAQVTEVLSIEHKVLAGIMQTYGAACVLELIERNFE